MFYSSIKIAWQDRSCLDLDFGQAGISGMIAATSIIITARPAQDVVTNDMVKRMNG
jgi:hypothetical protein